MKRPTGFIVALVLLGLSVILNTRLLLENYQLEIELGTLKSRQEQLAKAPRPAAPPPAAAATAPSPAGARSVIESARQMMSDALLAEEGDEKKLWMRVDPRDREASSFANEIAAVFRDHGWEVTVLDTEGMRYKPGLLFLVASEEEPPSYVTTAQRAIEAIGQPMTSGRGYLAYYESKKREDPNWRGTQFLPDQSYVLLVGRKPDPEATAAQ